VSPYQKGKTNLDSGFASEVTTLWRYKNLFYYYFTEARDSEWQWHQLDICKSAPHSRQTTMPSPHHSVFYKPDALPAAQPTASKHLRHFD